MISIAETNGSTKKKPVNTLERFLHRDGCTCHHLRLLLTRKVKRKNIEIDSLPLKKPKSTLDDDVEMLEPPSVHLLTSDLPSELPSEHLESELLDSEPLEPLDSELLLSELLESEGLQSELGSEALGPEALPSEALPSLKTDTPSTARSKSHIRNGRIKFTEERMDHRTARHTMRLHLDFLDEDWNKHGYELIESKYLPLIAKAVQDSDCTLETLSKQVVDFLYKADSPIAGFKLTPQQASALIKKAATRVNYGLCRNGNNPQNLSIWRWEVSNLEHFPADAKTKILERRTIRQQVHTEVIAEFETMSEGQQSTLIKPKASVKKSPKKTENPISAEKQAEKAAKEALKAEKLKEREAKELLKAEKLKEKEAKDALKAQKLKEKETKLAVKVAQQDMMGSFFTKVKDIKAELKAQSDFDQVFKPFELKAETVLAEALKMTCGSFEDYLLQIQSQDAVVAKQFARKAQKKKGFRYKLLQFKGPLDQGIRPAYWGTWLKTGQINPSLPFSKDSSIDYEYDSEDEWEEEEEGEDLASSVGDDGSEAESEEESDPFIDDASASGSVSSRKGKAVEQIVPVIVGPTFDGPACGPVVRVLIWDYLPHEPIDPFTIQFTIGQDEEGSDLEGATWKSVFAPEKLVELAHLLHGNETSSIEKLVVVLKEKFPEASKKELERRIKDMTVKGRPVGSGKPQFFVKAETWEALGEPVKIIPPFIPPEKKKKATASAPPSSTLNTPVKPITSFMQPQTPHEDVVEVDPWEAISALTAQGISKHDELLKALSDDKGIVTTRLHQCPTRLIVSWISLAVKENVDEKLRVQLAKVYCDYLMSRFMKKGDKNLSDSRNDMRIIVEDTSSFLDTLSDDKHSAVVSQAVGFKFSKLTCRRFVHG